MLAVTTVIVEKCASICYLTFYVLQAPPPRRGARGNFSPTLPEDGPGCVNNTLKN